MGSIAVKVEHLSKRYRLGVINNGTLWRDIQTWLALKRGKEDPHSRIGENKYKNTEDYFWALKDLNFEIEQGDRVGIIGANGAGKSTLLKIMSRITAPTEGLVKIKGKVASLLEVGTGFHGELTGRENIYLNGAILGMKRHEINRKLDEIIAFSEIEHHIDTPVKRYSSGMYVRLAFAVAAHLDSDILIADEVLAVGDAGFQKKALGKMQDLSTGQGRTVLFVSHNMTAVSQLCNVGIILKQGNIVYIGSRKEAVAAYLGKTDIGNKQQKPSIVFGEEFSKNEYFVLKNYAIVYEDTNIIPDSNILPQFNSYELLINFEIKKKHSNLVVFFSISNSEHENIWVSDIFKDKSVKPENIKIGSNEIRVKLPFKLLTDNKYFISVSSVIHFLKWEVEPNSTSIAFELKSTEIFHSIYDINNHPVTGKGDPSVLLYTPKIQISN